MASDSLRSAVYSLLTVIAVAAVAARICNIELLFEPSMYRAEGNTDADAPPRDWPKARPAPMPTLSSNDRSRWCSARSLVDEGTWVIGHRFTKEDGTYRDEGIVFEDGWQTVDKVLDPKPHGNDYPKVRNYYSSKPPLLTFVTAGAYWLLKHGLGWSITRDTNLVVKTILLAFNAVPFTLFLVMMRRLIERLGTTDWGRLFAFAAACFATLIVPFSITLNNHTLAAVTTLAAIYPLLRNDETPSALAFISSGFFAGLTVCLEFPAAAFLGLLGLAMLWRDWRLTLLLFAPAALLPIAAEVLLNYAAIHEWAPVYRKFGGPWYEYPGSHWAKTVPEHGKISIDFARHRESIYAYSFHVLIGHHGLFSLTPIWLLSFTGMFAVLRRGNRPHRLLAVLTLPLSLVVIGFYMVDTVNYGGWTSGLRWLIWLTPLWLLTLLPIADRLAASKWGRRLGYALLAVSAFSASYPAWNPWRHPWIYHFMEARGWLPY